MRKMKLTLKIVALTLLVLIPFLSVFTVAFLLPSEFDGSFVGALDEKLSRLNSIEEDKIVIIGGSSTAFGYDSRILEKYLDMPVVNLGLYAALGTKVMLDLSKEGIREGDIVILAPELDAQTLSLYFSASTTLRALDSSPKYLLDVPGEHTTALLGALWDFAADKLNYKIFGSPDYSGIYSSSSFNEYGDIGAYRKENVMQEYYDPNLEINLSEGIIDLGFIDYLNGYIDYCESVGASVYFEFCPMNRLAISENSEPENARLEFEEYIREKIDCTVISASIEDYIYDEGYFYDSNFHLNSAGAVMHTAKVAEDLLLELGIPRSVDEKIPEPPALPERDVRYFAEDENDRFFEYEKMSNGAYMIVGIKDEYLSEKTLTVPLGYEGYKVMAIGSGAFSGSSLEKLIITEDTNIRQFLNGAFLGAGALREMYIYYPTEEDISPPADFVGTADGFKVFIPFGSNYASGYFWSERNLTFEYIID